MAEVSSHFIDYKNYGLPSFLCAFGVKLIGYDVMYRAHSVVLEGGKLQIGIINDAMTILVQDDTPSIAV